MKRTIPLVLALAAGPALAQDTRQLDAHEHGVGVLDIAVDGTELVMEFHAPGADIVGFEYVAETDADRARIADAVAVLERPLDLFALPAAAGCSVIQADAELETEDAHHDDHAGDDHADHDHDHAEDDHDHAEHDHAEEGHSDEDHAAEASHTEFHAAYRLTCTDPSALTRMTFPYFDAFENAREVEVQVVTAAGAQAFEVERDAPTLDMTGLF